MFAEEKQMPSILLRDVDELTKRRLAVRAAQNGRSMQAEAKEILRQAVEPEETKETWIAMLGRVADQAGGYELDIPSRKYSTPAHLFDESYFAEGE
jgi:plasmid stability protein